MRFDAILPAGGHIDAEFAAKVGTSSKALIRFGDQTILERTILALKATGRVERIVISGPPEVRDSEAAKLATKTVPSGNSGPESILFALKSLMAEPNPPKEGCRRNDRLAVPDTEAANRLYRLLSARCRHLPASNHEGRLSNTFSAL